MTVSVHSGLRRIPGKQTGGESDHPAVKADQTLGHHRGTEDYPTLRA